MVYQQVYWVMETKKYTLIGSWFVSILFYVYSPTGQLVYRFISPCVLSLDRGIVSGLLVYFSMQSLTGQLDSVRFTGLFGLSVYFSMRSL